MERTRVKVYYGKEVPSAVPGMPPRWSWIEAENEGFNLAERIPSEAKRAAAAHIARMKPDFVIKSIGIARENLSLVVRAYIRQKHEPIGTAREPGWVRTRAPKPRRP